MSKKLFLLPALVMGAFLLFMPACGESDPCKDVECGANGICIEGACDCDPGYELGTSGQCDTEWSAKFVAASYTATSNCSGPYVGSIARISANKIRINEYGGFTGPNFIEADVNAANTLSVNYLDVANRRFVGTGTLSGRSLTLTLSIDYNDGGPLDNCTDILTLQ